MLRKNLFLLTFAILLVAGCTFSSSNAVNNPVSNGQIVLVKKGISCYGAFILKDQTMEPEQMKFCWYYREDGKGTFRKAEKALYKSGSGGNSPGSSTPYYKVRFGPFDIGWSGNEDGKGFLYYSHFEGEAISPGDILICVTNETDIEKIDATDPKWVYKGSPSDPGIRANGAKVSE